MGNLSIKLPESVSKLPECIRVYRRIGEKGFQEMRGVTVVMSVDTSKEACELYSGDIRTGDVFEMPLGSGWPDVDEKKLIAVGIGETNQDMDDRGFQMFFYIEGDDGISHFGKHYQRALKCMKAIGFIDLP